MLTSVRPQAWISDAANCIDSDDRRCAWKLAETLEAQAISEVAAIIPDCQIFHCSHLLCYHLPDLFR